MDYNQRKILFVETINAIKEQEMKDEEFNNLTRNFDVLGQGLWYDNRLIIEQLIKLLQKLFDKDSNSDNVNWWIYETNFGKSHPIVGPNENQLFYINNPEDLFDFINDKYDNLKTCTKEQLDNEPF